MAGTLSPILEIGQGIFANSKSWYKVIQWLGKGGNAVTYLVLCSEGSNRGNFFALKFFYRLSDPDRRQNFLAEIDFLKGCCHPSIMQIFDEGIYSNGENEYPYVVTEYLPTTLQQLDYKSLNLCDKLSITIQLLSGLVHLNSLEPPVVHRDIKPANIFLKGRSCILGDFGLLKRIDGQSELDREVFKQSVGPGMPFRYRTPDLVDYANNVHPLTTKTDVFQLGLVIAELFTLVNPCKESKNLLAEVDIGTFPFIKGTLGGRIASLIKQMLILEPVSRPSALELLPPWERTFIEAVQASHVLHGDVFKPFVKMNYRY